MQELERILEEIDLVKEEIINLDCWDDYNAGIRDMAMMAKQIIHKHRNDGWIPVGERLPENDDMMLVTCQTKAGRRSVNRAWYGEGFWHGSGSMSGVIAWRPLPEPYRPERSSDDLD